MIRVIEKLDSYYAKNDTDGALRHILYWIEEAKAYNDNAGLFTLYNELMGHCRKEGLEKEAFEAVESALELIPMLGLENTMSAATAYINTATVYTAFEKAAEGLPYFDKAAEILENSPESDDFRLASLYNNMASAVWSTGDFSKAEGLYNKALRIMEEYPGGEIQRAVTYLNMANMFEAKLGLEGGKFEIEKCMETARKMFDCPSLERGSYYAYASNKAVPVFEHYGYGDYAAELAARAEKIYAQNA